MFTVIKQNKSCFNYSSERRAGCDASDCNITVKNTLVWVQSVYFGLGHY